MEITLRSEIKNSVIHTQKEISRKNIHIYDPIFSLTKKKNNTLQNQSLLNWNT